MKRIIALCLIIAICMSFAGCESGQTSNNEQKTIELTLSNINEYMRLSTSFGDNEHKVFSSGYVHFVDVDLSVFPIAAGFFENVVIKIKLTAPRFWIFSPDEITYDENEPDVMSLTINVPVSGEYSKTHVIVYPNKYEMPDSDCTIEIVSVSGTFTKR